MPLKFFRCCRSEADPMDIKEVIETRTYDTPPIKTSGSVKQHGDTCETDQKTPKENGEFGRICYSGSGGSTCSNTFSSNTCNTASSSNAVSNERQLPKTSRCRTATNINGDINKCCSSYNSVFDNKIK